MRTITGAKPKDGGETRASARDEFLGAVSTLMRERDDLDIPLAEIAARAGGSAALVKYYFGNKEGLYFALLERDVKASLASMEALLATKMDPLRMLRSHLTGLVRGYSRTPYLNRLIQIMLRECSPERREVIVRDFVAPVARAHEHILTAGIEAGVFRVVDPMLFYFQAIGSADSLYSHKATVREVFHRTKIDEETHEKNVKQVVDILVNGVLKHPKDGA
ncbi:MAG: TetR/AcrR family transcriptional regulator [Hyphomonadaceae bacterium]|nr:TetR/AcrR family transcriptional regulator [Hyphomonadaceae bacterium]